MSDTLEIENKYNTKSLDFINSYKAHFSPLLSNIAATLNNNSVESNSIIAAMKAMTNTPNSNLKELIVKLKEMEDIGGNKARPISHNGDYSKYVAQCLRLIQLQHSKRQRHSLFSSVMRDMKTNPDLMAQLKTLKASTHWGKNASTDWKKMVGMLIPEGANVKILTTVIEPSTRFKLSNKFTAVSGKEITGTVVKRAKLTGKSVYGKSLIGKASIGEFKKLVKLQEDLIRNKGDNNVEFSPEHIQLIETDSAVPVVTENFVSSSDDTRIPVATPVASGAVATVASGAVATGASGASVASTPVASTPIASGATVASTPVAGSEAVASGASGATAATGSPGASGTPVASTPVATVASGATAATGSPGASGSAAKPVAEPVTTAVTPQVNLEDIKVTVATETPRAGGIMHGDQQVEASAGDEMSDGIYGRRGGSQRLTRKNTKTMGTARKTRTNH